MANPTGCGGFKKGKSGNPGGRPRGTRNKATLLADQIFDERLFGDDRKADAIISKAIARAEGGDTTCISALPRPDCTTAQRSARILRASENE